MDKASFARSFLIYAAKATFTFVLVILAVLLSLGTLFSKSEDITETRYFNVDGKATREVVPDEINITLGAFVEGTDIVKIQNEANTKIDKAVKSIEKLGIPKENIKTSSYNLSPKYDYQSNKIENYTINVEIKVKVENVTTDDNQAGDVIEAAAGVGLNEVRSLNYGVSNRDEILDELKVEAIENAKSRKDSLADASGLKLGDLEDVNFGYSNPYFYDDYARDEAGFAAPQADSLEVKNIEIQPGETELSATVTLVYKIL